MLYNILHPSLKRSFLIFSKERKVVSNSLDYKLDRHYHQVPEIYVQKGENAKRKNMICMKKCCID